MKIEVNPIKINKNVFDIYSYIEKRIIIEIGGYEFFRVIIYINIFWFCLQTFMIFIKSVNEFALKIQV